MTALRGFGLDAWVIGAVCVVGLGCPSADDAANSGDTGTSAATDGTTTVPATVADDGPTPTTGATPPPATTDSSTGAGSSDGGTDTGATGSGSGDTTGDTTGGEGSTDGGSSDSGSSGTTGEPIMPCTEQCEVELMCGEDWKSVRACAEPCEANLVEAELFAPFCRSAWEELALCLGSLTCEEFAEWQSPVEIPYPCISEDEGLVFECKGQ